MKISHCFLMRHSVVLLVWAAFLCRDLVIAQMADTAIDPKLIFQPIRVLMKTGTPKMGFFGGLREDSVVVMVNGKSEAFHRSDVLQIAIVKKAESSKATLIGSVLGLYAGCIIWLRADQQPFCYTYYRDESIRLLFSFGVGISAGAGFGSLIGSRPSGEIVFNAANSEQENVANWERFCDEISKPDEVKDFHISIQSSWVQGFPQMNSHGYGTSYAYSTASSFNLVRKVQASVSISEAFDAGIAIMFLGEPSFSKYGSDSLNRGGTYEMQASGYFAVGVFKPLSYAKLSAPVQLDLGLGVGAATVRARAESQRWYYPYPSPPSVSEINTTTLSFLLFAELKAFPTDYLSLGLVTDYAHIPEDMPSIPTLSYERKKIGTSSIGFVVGFHF